MAADTIAFNVRLPRQIHARLTEQADAMGLSLNALLVFGAWNTLRWCDRNAEVGADMATTVRQAIQQ